MGLGPSLSDSKYSASLHRLGTSLLDTFSDLGKGTPPGRQSLGQGVRSGSQARAQGQTSLTPWLGACVLLGPGQPQWAALLCPPPPKGSRSSTQPSLSPAP